MEVAVTVVLADVLSQLTARDVFGDWRILPGFKPSRGTASQAAGGPHSAGISGSRRWMLISFGISWDLELKFS